MLAERNIRLVSDSSDLVLVSPDWTQDKHECALEHASLDDSTLMVSRESIPTPRMYEHTEKSQQDLAEFCFQPCLRIRTHHRMSY